MAIFRLSKSIEKNQKLKKLCKNCQGSHRPPYTSEDVLVIIK